MSTRAVASRMSSVSGLNASHPQPRRPQDGLPHAPLQRDRPVYIGRDAKFKQAVAIFRQLVAKIRQFVGKNLILVDKLCRSLKNSNQDEGGVIVFGIDEKKDFEIVGVYDAQDIQKKVNEQSKEKGNRPNKGVLRSCRRRGRADERI